MILFGSLAIFYIILLWVNSLENVLTLRWTFLIFSRAAMTGKCLVDICQMV